MQKGILGLMEKLKRSAPAPEPAPGATSAPAAAPAKEAA
jgi:urea transport system permease protein